MNTVRKSETVGDLPLPGRYRELLTELNFALAGERIAVPALEVLSKLIESADFNSAEHRAARANLLDGELFPGCAKKKTIGIGLLDGSSVEGKFEKLDTSQLRFWTQCGLIRVPVALIPAELRDCFEGDETITVLKLTAVAKEVQANAAGVETVQVVADAMPQPVSGLIQDNRRLRVRVLELEAALNQ